MTKVKLVMVEHKTKQHLTEYQQNILITKKLLTYVQLIEVHMQEQPAITFTLGVITVSAN